MGGRRGVEPSRRVGTLGWERGAEVGRRGKGKRTGSEKAWSEEADWVVRSELCEKARAEDADWVVRSELCRVWEEWENGGKGPEHPLLETGVVQIEHPLLETGVGDGRYDG